LASRRAACPPPPWPLGAQLVLLRLGLLGAQLVLLRLGLLGAQLVLLRLGLSARVRVALTVPPLWTELRCSTKFLPKHSWLQKKPPSSSVAWHSGHWNSPAGLPQPAHCGAVMIVEAVALMAVVDNLRVGSVTKVKSDDVKQRR
jgi:hypothetical protein